jgi:hypothetical protein
MSYPPVSRRAPAASALESAPPGRPLVFELVGPAGAGKTSVLQAIAQRDATLCGGIRLSRFERATGALRTLHVWGPAAATLFLSAPGAAPGALRHVLRVRTLRDVLERPVPRQKAVLLDEGPVFSLARLRALGARRTPTLLNHEARYLNAWGEELDGIIWLDACDTVLAQRIRTRAKAHRVKHSTDIVVRGFLEGYRQLYQEVLADFQRCGVPVHTFDTSQVLPGDVVDSVLQLIEAARHEQ